MRRRWQLNFISLALLSLPLRAQQLSFVELPTRTPGVPVGISAASFYHPLVTELEGNSIAYAFQPDIEFQIPTPNSGPMGIAAFLTGGEFWFTESRANKIGRIRLVEGSPITATFLPEIAIPTAGSAPHGIASSPVKSEVWFTEFAGNKIGRAAVTDLVNGLASVTGEFPVPTPNSGPAGIAVDNRLPISANPAIWFTESSANKIGRLDPSTGTVDEFPIPIPNSTPLEIVQSGDAFWFTESNARRIGRIRSDGQITQYVISNLANINLDSIPYGIAADGVGGVWFTERGSGLVGRLTVDGRIQEFRLPTADSGPVAIATWSPSSIPLLGPGGDPSLLVVESTSSKVAIAAADSLVLVGAGYSDGWDTEVEASDPEGFSILGNLGLGRQSGRCVIHDGCPPPPNFQLAPHTTARRMLSEIGAISGFYTYFFISDTFSSAPLDLPSVKARVFNRSVPGPSVDLPVTRYSTILRLNPAALCFPSVTKKAGGPRSNLIISSVDTGAVSFNVELFSASGDLLASAPFVISSVGLGSTLFIQDIAGTLGVTDLEQGSARVTRTGGFGLLWGVLMTVAEDGSLTYSVGQNP